MVSKANIKNKYTDREKNSCLYLVTARQVATPIAGGACFMKSYGTMEGVYINGAPQGITFHETDDFTPYPASILSVSRNRFTKHYFIGSQRIASRIGVGRFNNVYGINGSRVTAGQKDYAARMSQIEAQKEEYYKSLGIAPGVPTMKGSYGDPENTGVGYNSILTELGKHDVPENWMQLPKKDGKGNSAGSGASATPGTPIAWEDPSNPENAQPGYGYVAGDTTELEETFYYHSDHLGSTTYVTDEDGNITQYEAYLPYGELLVDEHSSSESMPYKFNGKQLDDETGLYYYGARYMNPVASVWYGVDPLVEKYSNISGFCYVKDNPLKFVDYKGEEPTASEAARMAAHVYGDKKNILINGWKVSNKSFGAIKLVNSKSGLNSAVYERTTNGKTEYAYVFAGTDMSEYNDVKADVKQAYGFGSRQYDNAVLNASVISNKLKESDSELTFVGHSLGGGEAALCALVTNRKAITFNAAGLHKSTLVRFRVNNKSQSGITAYILKTDPLDFVQRKLKLPTANGNHIYLNPVDLFSEINGHSINNILKKIPDE
jgi:RHS repeat-associated protein